MDRYLLSKNSKEPRMIMDSMVLIEIIILKIMDSMVLIKIIIILKIMDSMVLIEIFIILKIMDSMVLIEIFIILKIMDSMVLIEIFIILIIMSSEARIFYVSRLQPYHAMRCKTIDCTLNSEPDEKSRPNNQPFTLSLLANRTIIVFKTFR